MPLSFSKRETLQQDFYGLLFYVYFLCPIGEIYKV